MQNQLQVISVVYQFQQLRTFSSGQVQILGILMFGELSMLWMMNILYIPFPVTVSPD